MAKWIMPDSSKWIEKIAALGDDAEKMCRGGAGEGAKMALDAIRANIQSLPVVHYNQHTEMINGVSQAEKDGLLEGLGATSMQNENGYIYTKIGFAGYNSSKTKKYPQGQPNAMIARSVVKGTSFRKRFPFVDKAFKPADIEKVIEDYVNKAIEKKMKG